MGKLIRYLRNYKKESIIGPLFKMLEAGFELLVPLLMADIIDVGIRQRDLRYILIRGIFLVGIGILGLTCSVTAQYFAAKAAAGFGTELRNDLFAHLNQFSYRELDRIGTSTLVTRMTSDINQAQTGVNQILRLFLRSPFIVAGAMVMAFTIDVKLAIIFAVIVPVLAVIIYLIMVLGIPLYKKVQSQLDRVLLITRENLSGARVIRAFSRQEDERKAFEEESQQLLKTQLLVGKISALMNPLTYVVVNLGIIFVLWFGGRTVFEGSITQGELLALISYMSQILLALLALAMLITSFTKATASAMRINDVFAMESSMKEGTAAVGETGAQIKVEFQNISFAYGEGEDALTNISFRAGKGETIGIIGGTGSGKSSLVNLIPRFYDVKNGSVLVDGVAVQNYSFKALRSQIGTIPQNAVLFAGTIRENMQWGKKGATDEEIWKALQIAQAAEFVMEKSEGLETVILQGGKNLSGGQRQRLTIARALVGQPDILIMDDSASALDFATDVRLRQAILKETKGMTVFIVSQRATTIKNADQIIVLEDGEMAGMGTHEELLENCEIYKEICLSQLSEKELQTS